MPEIILDFRRRMTSFSRDHFSSTAHTLMSTRPSGNATSRTTSSVISVGSFAAFLYHETQIAPSCLISFLYWFSPAASPSRLLVKKCMKSSSLVGLSVTLAPAGSGVDQLEVVGRRIDHKYTSPVLYPELFS